MKINYLILSICIPMLLCAQPRINLFRPSDRPLFPEPVSTCWTGQLSVGYEGAFNIRAFQDVDDELFQTDLSRSSCDEKKVCILQLYTNTQNVIGALKGTDSQQLAGQLSQRFNRNDEAGTQGLFEACGCLEVPLNALFSYRYYFDYGLRLEFHLPVIHAELKNVCWRPLFGETTPEKQQASDLISSVSSVVGLTVDGWKRTGIGDLVIQAAWMRSFPQFRTFLQDVRIQTRFGVVFPTGKTEDEDRVLAFPFGNDGAWAVQFAGGIDLDFGYCLRGGIDVEFLYQFGHLRCRRVKRAPDQTSLSLPATVPVYREYGLGQQYNLYLEAHNFWRNTSLKVNYQFLKKNDDQLAIASDSIDAIVANESESLFDWTAHSLIFMGSYELWREYESSRLVPSLTAWVKWGFNGKRALLANTAGFEVSVAF